MSYKVYSGPRGAEMPSPLEKHTLLFKECATLDEAFAWAKHVEKTGRTALLIEGEDGTQLGKREIAAAMGATAGASRG